MFVRVLGTVAVGATAESTVEVTSPRHRLVLAILAANRGNVVPAGRLVDLVWPDGAPATAETSLQGTISQLRRVLEPDLAPRSQSAYLVTRSNGYCLEISPTELDLDVLRHLIAEVVEQPTELRLTEMLAIWDEPIFSEFAETSWARPLVARLEEGRLAAIARHAAEEIKAGRADDLVITLQSELDQNPFDERLAGLLMMSLGSQGRQADALRVYESVRVNLRDQLGLEPTTKLRDLERSILEQDPAVLGGQRPIEAGSRSDLDPTPVDSSLIGRDRELAELVRLVSERQLVTVHGPAGAGKTTIARAALHQVERARTYFVDLTSVTDDAGVDRRVADAVGLLAEPTVPTLKGLTAFLRQEPTVLLLDNCEELLDGVRALVGALVDHPQVTIMATSRRLLDLSTETTLRLPPLDLPQPDDTPSDVFASPACRLLLARAGTTFDDREAGTLGSICRLLDGLPLAIELGAYRLRSAGPTGLLHDLEAERDLGGPSDLAPHQRSLDATLDRSVASLSPVANDALVALGVFADSVPLEAVQQLLADRHNPEAVRVAVSDLVDRSLVTMMSTGTRGTSVVGLLETVRAYTRRIVERNGATDEWRRQHVGTVAKIAATSRSRADSLVAIADIDAEIGRALDYLETAADDGPTHHKLVTDIGSYWYRSGRLREAQRRMDVAIELHPDVDPLWRGITLAAAGLMSFSSGDFRRLDVLLSEAVDVLRGIGFEGLELLEAAQLVARHDLDGVEDRITAALGNGSVSGFQRAIALDVAAYSGWFAGDYPTAIERFHQQERAAATAGDLFLQGRAIRGRGLMLAYQGSPESGAVLLQRSIDLIDDWENDRSATQVLAIRSVLHLLSGRFDDARRDSLAAMRRASRRFDGNPMMVTVPVMASVEAEAGRWENVARISGWLRGICTATGMYLPAPSEELASAAEEVASGGLRSDEWSALRSDGASGGLAGLVEVLSAAR